MDLTAKTVEETKEFGKKVSRKVQAGDIIALQGELGSGKTTFMQGVLEGFGITSRVTSPTFVFMKMYKTPKSGTVFHFDLYRLEREEDAKVLGLSDIFSQTNAITFIEWAEKIANLLPKTTKHVTFEKVSDNERKIHADWIE